MSKSQKPKMHSFEYLVMSELRKFMLQDDDYYNSVISLLCKIYDPIMNDSYLWLEYSDVDEYAEKKPDKFANLVRFVQDLKEFYPDTLGINLYIN